MTNYRTVYVVNPSKRHFDGMLDGITYKVPAKGFLPVVHFVAKHIMAKNEALLEFESIIDVITKIKELGTYDVYFTARAAASTPAPEAKETEDTGEGSDTPPVE